MNWGYYIKKLRLEARMTQSELERKSGLKRSHISNIERGVYKTYKPEIIERLAQGLGKTTKEIIDCIYSEGIGGITEKSKEETEEIKITCVLNGNIYSGSLKLVR
ncbi:MAG TPA: helix-turn-helix transcriptional regulator [Dehalococcoidales bacterium]|nr:helix-turn-helix transcriptional regulator [Dehalococcoidales bacterium]